MVIIQDSNDIYNLKLLENRPGEFMQSYKLEQLVQLLLKCTGLQNYVKLNSLKKSSSSVTISIKVCILILCLFLFCFIFIFS